MIPLINCLYDVCSDDEMELGFYVLFLEQAQ